MALRSSLAHIRVARISPAVLTAPPAGFVPPRSLRARGAGAKTTFSWARRGESISMSFWIHDLAALVGLFTRFYM